MIYYNLGGICIRRGDTEGASALYQRSMELKKGALGDNLEIAVDFQHGTHFTNVNLAVEIFDLLLQDRCDFVAAKFHDKTNKSEFEN